MGCGFYALWSDRNFMTTIMELTMEGGDAGISVNIPILIVPDTNCAVAGAVLGCKLGYRALPEDWLYGIVLCLL